ncbi:MAG: 2-oxoglutarate and iron-dependent oxygenase domain-containing protein, partial [Phenylobacterium sp.]
MSQSPAPPGLPPVDFNDWSADFEGFSRRLGDSFVRYGFCVIAHHDLDLPRIDRALEASRAFFALPEAVKRRYVTGIGGQRGYTPFGVETAKDSQHFDLKEFWHVGRDLPA